MVTGERFPRCARTAAGAESTDGDDDRVHVAMTSAAVPTTPDTAPARSHAAGPWGRRRGERSVRVAAGACVMSPGRVAGP